MKLRFSLWSVILILATCAAAQPPPQLRQPRKPKNEDKEPVTQALPLLKDPPAAVAAETSKLTFHVSPLSAKGLLSPQTRDAIGALMKMNRGAQIVKLRAFVAGTGDMRRVQSIVSEIFTDKKQPLPALSTIQVGALPLEGAQVVIESISEEKKPTHSFGLVFFSGQQGDDPAGAISRLAATASSAHVAPGGMLRMTCFLGSVDEIEAARSEAARAFPNAAMDFVQALRGGAGTPAVCEGVGARDSGSPDAEIPGAAFVDASKLIFSGAQLAFRDQDDDLRLAFERLDKSLEQLGASYKDVVFSNLYPLTRAMEDKGRKIEADYLPRDSHPAGTTLLFEGLPSLDSTLAIEVVAAVRN